MAAVLLLLGMFDTRTVVGKAGEEAVGISSEPGRLPSYTCTQHLRAFLQH